MCASVAAIANPGKNSNAIVFEKQDSVVRQKTGDVVSGSQGQQASSKLNTSSAVQDSLPVVSAIDGTEPEVEGSSAQQDTTKTRRAKRGVNTQDTSIPVTVQAPGITVRPLKDTVSDTTQTHVALVQDMLHSDSTVKKGFFRKFYNYFKTANVDKTLTKKFDFSIIGGPHYSGDIKLGLGIVAAGLYRVDRKDLSIHFSVILPLPDSGCWEFVAIRCSKAVNSGWIILPTFSLSPVLIGESAMITACMVRLVHISVCKVRSKSMHCFS